MILGLIAKLNSFYYERRMANKPSSNLIRSETLVANLSAKYFYLKVM